MNGLVIDLSNGNILKLGEHKMVLRAYFGFERLSQERIEAFYGSPPIFKKFNEDILLTDEYFCCLTFFNCYFPLVFAKMTEIIKGKKNYLEKKEINKLLSDAESAIEYNYNHYNKDLYVPIACVGDYYRNIIEHKDKYLYKHDRMVFALQQLRKQGKVTFIITDSHYEFAEELMSYSYGDKWREYFDFIIVNGQKKRFFVPNDNQFREIIISEQNRMGLEVFKLEKYKMYTGGNVKALENNIRNLTRNAQGRILYVGDNYSHDILASKRLPGWDAVCVMEELYGLDIAEGYDGRVWGNWKYEKTPYGIIPTFWYNEMMKKADKCVPRVDSEEMIRFYLGEHDLKEEETREGISECHFM